MEIDVQWDDSYCGYVITHNCPDMYKIDPNEGNGDENEFYENIVLPLVFNELDALDIGPTLLASY